MLFSLRNLDEDEDLVPLFKLIPGVATSSDGLACAKLGGLPAPLIGRAHEIMALLEQGRPITPAVDVCNGSQTYGPGSAGNQLLCLFLDTLSFNDADDDHLAAFKSLIALL